MLASIVLAAAFAAVAGGAIAACLPERDQKPWVRGTPAPGDLFGAGGDDGFIDAGPVAPGPDAGGLCGNEFHTIEFDAPNVYFVLDASGSMAEQAKGGSRYEIVREAVVDLVRDLGPLINVGAAVFPVNANVNPCGAGAEVMPVTPGDPPGSTETSTTEAFEEAIDVVPNGGTPTGKTLAVLAPTLAQLPGKTIVVLATDGGPNCNSAASCGIDDCVPNIEGSCDPGTNCCAPGGVAGPELCIDREATLEAISAIAADGIEVYVIGIPGSEVYEDVLDEMAVAGGAPLSGKDKYYRVTDLDDLGGVLGSIAGQVLSCEFPLESPPDVPNKTNVYLDGELLPFDEKNGWSWKSESVVELNGEACERLKGGEVKQVQVVSGCPTSIK